MLFAEYQLSFRQRRRLLTAIGFSAMFVAASIVGARPELCVALALAAVFATGRAWGVRQDDPRDGWTPR